MSTGQPDRPLDSQMRSVLARLQVSADDTVAAPEDVHALHTVFAAYRPSVFALARRLTGEAAAAEDLTQQVLMTAWDRLPDFRGDARFSAWLYGITVNHWRNVQRKRRELLAEDGVFDGTDPAIGVLSALQRSEREAVFRQVCEDCLSDQEQRVVYLRYVRELPRPEIESLLGLHTGESRVAIQRCRRKLERALRQRLADLGHGTSFVRSSA